MNGFHIRKKVMVDHKTWPLSCKSDEVNESVKTSVNGNIELKTRKRLIFMWSFRKLNTLVLGGAESRCPLMLSVFAEVFLLQLAAGGKWKRSFLIRTACRIHCGS